MTEKEASIPFEMVKVVAEKFLRAMYGSRCNVFQKGCECCERWKALDCLVDNPFKNPKKKQRKKR